MDENVKVYNSLKTDMVNTIKTTEDEMGKFTRRTLVDIPSLIRFVTAILEEGKTARFINGNPGIAFWPSLTLCIHKGALYQLWSTTALVGYKDVDPNEDRQKVWVKISER